MVEWQSKIHLASGKDWRTTMSYDELKAELKRALENGEVLIEIGNNTIVTAHVEGVTDYGPDVRSRRRDEIEPALLPRDKHDG